MMKNAQLKWLSDEKKRWNSCDTFFIYQIYKIFFYEKRKRKSETV